jgi:hypothetical protein
MASPKREGDREVKARARGQNRAKVPRPKKRERERRTASLLPAIWAKAQTVSR